MKTDLLFVTPVFPAPGGNGLAMRCHAFLRVLAMNHRVFLLVANRPPPGHAVADLGALCDEVACRPIGLWGRRGDRIRGLVARVPALYRRGFPEPSEWAAVRRASSIPYPFRVSEFDRVHVFRLYMTPLLDAFPARVSWRQTQLDLDELESLTRRRLGPLHVAFGDAGAAARVGLEAQQYEAFERERLARFDRLFVCSEVERERIRKAGLHPTPEVAPNVVDASREPAPPRHSGPFRFLFVGTLGYLPNADAVWQFASRVLPRLRSRGLPAILEVAGAGLPRSLARDLAAFPAIRLLGFVPDLTPAYRDADAVVVPVRAGGGTRIKVLEAFGRGRPVVSTAAGIEGIDARHERHALIGELPEAFTTECERLIREPELARALCSNALDLVRQRYSERALRAVIFGEPAA